MKISKDTFVLIILELCCIRKVLAAIEEDMDALRALLTNYDASIPPSRYVGGPTQVSVNMFLNSIGPINAAEMDFSVDMFLRESWADKRLVLKNTSIPRLILSDVKDIQRVWKAGLYFQNVKESHIHMVTTPNTYMIIYPHGHVISSMRISLKLSCHMQLQDYPQDIQKCSIKMAPWNYSCLEVHLEFRRQYGHHIIQTYVPTVFVVMISWVSCWLHPDAIPARVTLGVTTVLTLTTIASGVRAKLPPVSYIKAIDIWMGGCTVFVFVALLEFTLVNYFHRRKNPKHNHLVPYGRKVDWISRIVLPALFFLFVTAYWPLYT